MSDDIHREAKLRRMLEETEKFVAESHKLEAERRKLEAERFKLVKESWWFPWLQLLTLVVSSAGIGALVARLIPLK